MSDGVAIVRSLLVAATAVTNLVPVTRITAGPLPQNVTLPGISITSVSSNDRNIVQAGANRHVTERVQVTVLAANYPSQKAVLAAVKKACADKFPTVAGATDITVHTDSAGPDFMNEEASIYQGSQDFTVGFNQTT